MDTSKSWSPIHYFSFATICILGIFCRFYNLDLRPLHHDESLHGMYSLYYFKDSVSGYYKYNPLLHGPLLYHSLPWSYWLFGINKFAVRLPSAVLGSLLLFLPLLLKRYLSKYSVLALTLLIAFSPTMVYWSRFIRHDNFIFASLLLLLFALIKTIGFTRYILIALSIALQFSCKENTFIHIVFVIAFFVYEFLVIKVLGSSANHTVGRLFQSIKRYKFAFLISIVSFTLVFTHYYTAGFVYWEGFLDGAYRKSLFYWFEQHQKERISGPFSYSFLINSFFESWWIPALLVHLFVFYKAQARRLQLFFLSSLLISAFLHLSLGSPIQYEFLAKGLKLKIPFDYYIFFPTIFHSIILTTVYILQEKKELASSGFFFFASLFTYSFLGEKVPWLALYPLISGAVFFTFFFDKLFQKPILLLLIPLLIFNIKTLLWSNYSHSFDPDNLLTQVHTSPEFENLMLSTREVMNGPPTEYLLIADSYAWPTTWYLNGLKGYHFKKQGKRIDTYQFILAKPEDSKINSSLSLTHKKKTIPLRQWWLPQYNDLDFKNAWNYFAFKKTWNRSGGNQVSLWTKKN